MEKKKQYHEIRFSADVLQAANDAFFKEAKPEPDDTVVRMYEVEHEDSTWTYDSIDEFAADYRRFNEWASLMVKSGEYLLAIHIYQRSAHISVQSPSRPEIERIFDVFEKKLDASQLPPLPEPPEPEVQEVAPVIFIGHGQSHQWRDLKDHLHEKHGYQVEAYETGARAGHTIRDILEEMVSKSSFALLVFTGEDEQADGGLRARQNVVHEAGLFQGKLGFPRAIMLFEDGVEDFSNVAGIQQIRFSKGNIKETFGEVVATLKREFDQ